MHEAALVMHEPVASILNREVVGSTRGCAYVGGSKKLLGHGVGVMWGPYADSRTMTSAFAAKVICPVSKAACSKLKTAATLRPDRKSFAAVEKALALIGTTRVQPRGLDNPAFVWKPSSRLAPLDETTFVVVYVVKSAHLLEVTCSDVATKTADTACAVRAASWVETNVS